MFRGCLSFYTIYFIRLAIPQAVITNQRGLTNLNEGIYGEYHRKSKYLPHIASNILICQIFDKLITNQPTKKALYIALMHFPTFVKNVFICITICKTKAF